MKFSWKFFLILLAGILAVGSGSPSALASAPTLALGTTQAQVTVVQGQSVSNSYTVKTGGSFSGPVSLNVAGLPAGVSASWSQSSFTPATSVSTTSSTLNFQVSSSTLPNWYNFTVTAAGDGLSVTWTYTLIVNQAPGVTATVSMSSLAMSSMGTASMNVIGTPFGGLSTTAALTQAQVVTGLPAGVTVAYGAPILASSGVVTCPLTFTGSTAALASTDTLGLSITVTDKNTGISYTAKTSSTLKVSLVAPTLNFSAASAKVTTGQGGSVSNVFTFVTGGSFHGPVTLSVAGLPSSVTTTWSNSAFTPATATSSTASTLTLSPSATLSPNWYSYTVTAAGDGLSVTWGYVLIVNQSPGVTATVNLPSFTMSSMGTASLNVVATPFGGMSTTAALTKASIVSGLPAGVTASFGTPTVSSTGVVTSPITFTGSTAALGGTSNLVFSVTATDQNTGVSYTSTASSSLKVSSVAPTLTLAAASTKIMVVQGNSVSNALTIATGGSFHGPVTLSFSGPAGVTGSFSNASFTPVSSVSSTSSLLTLSIPSSLTPNWYVYSVTAAGDGLSVTWAYTLIVDPLVGMTASVSSPAVSVNQGQPGSVTVTATPQNAVKFASGSATIAVGSALPAGVTASLGSPVTNSNGSVSWKVTFSAAPNATAGDVPVTLNLGIADSVSGMPYQTSQSLRLLVSLLADVTVGSTPGAPIPAGFLGLSHEWNDAQNMMGSTAANVNTIYRQLIGNLTAYNTGALSIRIGGNSTDLSTEPTSTTAVPFAQLAKALPVTFNLGVNLGSDNVTLAVNQATAFVNQMPSGSIQFIEIGNEPNLYASNGIRPTTYTYSDFLADNANWNSQLIPVLPSTTKLMGPAWGGYQTTSGTASFLANQSSSFGAYTAHSYAYAPSSLPSNDALLSSAAATTLPAALAGPVATAHAAGAVYRVDELGPISLTGVSGVSNGFQAALWSIDLMFGLAQNGVDGVNWEASDGNLNNPFVFNVTSTGAVTKSYTLTTVSPLYYGLLMFQQAVANQAQLMPLTLNTGANLSAWATLDPTTGVERIVLLNKDENNTGVVAINVQGYTTATVTRLAAPTYASTSGVTLGGQTFDGSTDGTIRGTPTQETYSVVNGVFQLNMPLTSGALVVLSE